MNRIRATAVAATLLSAFLVAPTWAQTETPRFDQRQANQEQRIDRATSTGSLTEREAARLEKGQDRLDKMEDKATADGTVTKKERARLEHGADVQSRHIARQAHDGQRDRNQDGKNDRRQVRKNKQ
ncbi:MAG: hypothetical protein IPH08_12720 [Rhodocyclaceae bacterium]|jgi:hypothetical protein|nr:hypothetical protein [Rhodocyclaceae bacterium]MBK6907874.1 hypothetical protein [Rhodocyclaceae bacterium]